MKRPAIGLWWRGSFSWRITGVWSISIAVSLLLMTGRALIGRSGAVVRLAVTRVLSSRLRWLSSIISMLRRWWPLHSRSVRSRVAASAWSLLVPWVVLSTLRVVIVTVPIRIALVRCCVSIGLLRVAILPIVLPVFLPSLVLGRVASLIMLFVTVAISSVVVVVIVLCRLLVYAISVVIMPSILLLGLAVALVIVLVIIVVLLRWRVAAVLSPHGSLLMLIVVGSAGSFIGSALVVRHAARTMGRRWGAGVLGVCIGADLPEELHTVCC